MVLEALISLMCAGVPANYNTACSKAVESAAVQSEFKKYSEKAEKAATKKVTDTTGEEVWGVGGAGYKAAKDKQIKYRIKSKNMPLGIDYVSPQIQYKDGNKGGSITFGWAF